MASSASPPFPSTSTRRFGSPMSVTRKNMTRIASTPATANTDVTANTPRPT